MKIRYHIWVGNKTGYVFSSSNLAPVRKPKERLKYMGTTTDIGWPKKMSTGRILYKPIEKPRKIHKKYKKNNIKHKNKQES